MFSRYYQSELTFLREMGRAYAAANPNVAGMLAERGGDPDVERVLEGFAFLVARIRERIDDGVPDIVHGLTELLLPHFLRPIPATSILELTPAAAALRGRVKIPRGSEIASVPIDGTSCRFRTTSDVELLPLSVRDVSLDRSVSTTPLLRLSFTTSEAGVPLVFQKSGVRLFLNGEMPIAGTLLLWLAHHCRSVTVRSANADRGVRLPGGSISLPGFEPESALLPWPSLSLPGYGLLQEYFTQPAKFLFVDVKNLHTAVDAGAEAFELVFELDRPPELPVRLSSDMFRLHCTPVVNLFDVDADPIRRDPLAHEHLLRASEIDPAHMEVFAVRSVTGVRSGEGKKRAYHPFVDFSHTGGADAATPAYYRTRRTSSPLDDGLDTYLSVLTPRDVAPDAGEETLSIGLTCSNRNLPVRLRAGDLTVPTAASPSTARFRNIAPVTAPARPPLGGDLHWRLLSHLALNQRSLVEGNTLQALLALYNFQGLVDNQAGIGNQLRIEAISRVEAKAVRRLFEGAPLRGVAVAIDVAEANFSGKGDAYLLGAIVDALFADHVTLNSFSEITLRLRPSNLEYSWPAKSGRQAIV